MDLDNFSRQKNFIEVRLIGGFRQHCRKTYENILKNLKIFVVHVLEICTLVLHI